MDIEAVATEVVDAAYRVHRETGPGLLESVYERCLVYELHQRGFTVDTSLPVGVVYRGVPMGTGYRMDIVVDGMIVLELKAVPKLLPVHEAQLLTYLRLSGLRLGFLINFHAPQLRDGIRRMVNGL